LPFPIPSEFPHMFVIFFSLWSLKCIF
jgi:hypothetical protein